MIAIRCGGRGRGRPLNTSCCVFRFPTHFEIQMLLKTIGSKGIHKQSLKKMPVCQAKQTTPVSSYHTFIVNAWRSVCVCVFVCAHVLIGLGLLTEGGRNVQESVSKV